MLGRGLVQSIMDEKTSDKGVKTNKKHNKGVYIVQRDLALMYRFFYYYDLKTMRYESVLEILNTEFYLSETRIAQIIMQRGSVLATLKAEKADRKYLANKFPHYSWV